ncbi:MAG: hypothetical protein AAGA85_14465 [Bacteroidota bacterium]
MIELSKKHLCLEAELVEHFFGREDQALLSYDEDSQRLLVAPSSSSWFAKMHKTSSFLLKTKNLKGDRSLAIHSILIDHEIDAQDRPLDYECNASAGWIKINLKKP